eukprot:9182842-Heterocapsa_arctica.AAC.1
MVTARSGRVVGDLLRLLSSRPREALRRGLRSGFLLSTRRRGRSSLLLETLALDLASWRRSRNAPLRSS